MAELSPCTHCRRHIAITEAACPFCQGSVELAASTPSRLGRVSRAVVFAGAALATAGACGGKKAKPTTQQQTAPADAGVQKTEPDTTKHMPMPYGAPPARRRFV
jgi:hypothetical protein